MKVLNFHSDNHQKWLKELSDIAPNLAALNKQQAFLVPPGYFQANAQSLMNLFDTLHDQTDSTPENAFLVPDHYFEQLSTNILNKIAKSENEPIDSRQEIQNEAPVLAGLKKENPFSVPENYFPDLNNHLLQKHRSRHTALALFKRSYFSISLAIAAVITGIIVSITLLQKTNTQDQLQLSHEVVADFMMNHIQDYSDDNVFDLLSDDELNDLYHQENNLNVSDEELDQYWLDDIDLQNLEDWL